MGGGTAMVKEKGWVMVTTTIKVLPWVRLIPTLFYLGPVSGYSLHNGFGSGSNAYFGNGMGQTDFGDGSGSGWAPPRWKPNGEGGGQHYGGRGF
jgi:hypothetical protein